METKKVALIIAFSALAIVLNPTISRLAIPVFYVPNTNLVYQFFEIPIVTALLLLDLKSGVAVSALNSVVLLFLYPGRTFLYPIANFAAVTSMMIGISAAIMLYRNRIEDGSYLSKHRMIFFSTALGIAFRIMAMTPIWYLLFIVSYPELPFNFFLTVVFPIEAIFNATLPLYTIPLAFFIGKIISKHLKIGTPTQAFCNVKQMP